jgi:D-aspartate ligase
VPATVVLGLSGGAYHHGVLGIARSLGRLGVSVHRVASNSWSPIDRSRYVAKSYSIDSGATTAELLGLLTRIGGALGSPLLIAVDDAAAMFVDAQHDQLSKTYSLPRAPRGLAGRLASKRGMYELCVEHDIPTARSEFPDNTEAATRAARALGFPVVVKCIDAGKLPRSAPRVLIVENQRAVAAAPQQFGERSWDNLFIQEHIPGGPDSVWMFNGYFNQRSECLFASVGRKLRQWPPYTGATTLGECQSNDTVYSQTIALMRNVGYVGPLDLGFRFDRRDGTYKLLDVNPRIGATFRLFVDDRLGVDVARAMYWDLNGRRVPKASAADGRRWLVEPLDVAGSVRYVRDHKLTIRRWLQSLRGVDECAWFARDDPAPFFLLAAGIAARTMRGIRKASHQPERAGARA